MHPMSHHRHTRHKQEGPCPRSAKRTANLTPTDALKREFERDSQCRELEEYQRGVGIWMADVIECIPDAYGGMSENLLNKHTHHTHA